MPYDNTQKLFRLSHLGRLNFVIPGLTLCVFFLAATLGIVNSRETAYTQTHAAVTKQLRDRITFIQGAAEEFLEIGLRDHLQQLISSLAADSDLISIHIVDENDQVLASNRLGDVGLSWKTLHEDFQDELINHVRRTQRLEIHHDAEHEFLETYASLCGESRPDRLRSKACGFINYRVDLKPHLQATSLALKDQSTYYILGMAVVVLVSLSLLHVLVTRRTERIASILTEFGDRDRSVRIKVDRNDEISDLGHSINRLLDKMVDDEKTIRDGHERLHALFDNVIDSVIVINDKGIIENANPATEHIFGYKPEEIIGQNVSRLMPEPMRSEHEQYLANYIETGIRKIIGIGREVEAVHKSGRRFPAELAISELHFHGQHLFTGIVRDISEQAAMSKRMEKAYEDLSKAHAKLEKHARIDKLTNLYNRGYFDTAMYTEIRRATRQVTPLSLMLLDIDYFKLFNDHYGHPEGDICLKEIANAIHEVFMRSSDVVARYGGEEFVVILPLCDKREAMTRADKLLQTVWDRAIPHEESNIADRVTVSIGVVTYRPNSIRPISPANLIKAADNMLYEAKAAGRNRICHDLLIQKVGDTTDQLMNG